MPKEAKLKAKLLYIAEALYKYSDENNALSAQYLIDYLAKNEIFVERKTIFSDIQTLKDFGIDIGVSKSRGNSGYYLMSRDFELPELKLITEAILSSKYITSKKSKELIGKLELLASPSERDTLKREVFVSGRVKTENESIYYNVDKLHNAMMNNSEITFKYLKWSSEKTLIERHEGKLYRVSPWALTVKDENYYLVSYDDKEDMIRHFRVDKLKDIRTVKRSQRKGHAAFRSFNIGEYTKERFGMYSGDQEVVTLILPEDKIGIIFDRFGKDIDVRKLSDDRVSVRVMVAVSGQFFGWITGIGTDIEIAKPAYIRTQYIDYLKQISSIYGI